MTAPLLAHVVAGVAPLKGLSDAGIAIGAAIALFLIRVEGTKAHPAVMDWETADEAARGAC